MDPRTAQDLLIEHLKAVAPWNVRVAVEREADGAPFTGSLDGPAYDAMSEAMEAVYGRDVIQQGQGGSIPLCNVFQDTFPDAEILLIGVEEPAVPDPRAERERRPVRDPGHGPGRGALPAELRGTAAAVVTSAALRWRPGLS